MHPIKYAYDGRPISKNILLYIDVFCNPSEIRGKKANVMRVCFYQKSAYEIEWNVLILPNVFGIIAYDAYYIIIL